MILLRKGKIKFMRKTIDNFFKVQKILNIIFLVLSCVAFVISITCLIINAVSPDLDETVRASLHNVGDNLGSELYGIGGGIAALVLGKLAYEGFNNAKNHDEAVKPGVLAIVAGALSGVFGIPAGIIMLANNEWLPSNPQIEEEPKEEE